jgi:hypothetical protein
LGQSGRGPSHRQDKTRDRCHEDHEHGHIDQLFGHAKRVTDLVEQSAGPGAHFVERVRFQKLGLKEYRPVSGAAAVYTCTYPDHHRIQ